MKLALFALVIFGLRVLAEDIPALCADRAAIERVYYTHRLGAKLPFEEVSPPALIERLVRDDLHKEAVLKKVYHSEISTAEVTAEVQRINATTRAPEILAELKAALNNDTNRFAQTVARPIVVERELRQRFDNDAQLHLPQRRQVESIRASLLAAKQNGTSSDGLFKMLNQPATNRVTETTWQLGARSPDKHETELEFCFEDLPADLKRVLRVQLQKAGDISAVIDIPDAFVLYLAREMTGEKLRVAVLTIPKRSFEEWLAQN